MPFVPDSPAQPAASAKANHFVPDAPAAPSGFWGDFAHELWQQGGQPLLEGLQNHPIATLAHLLGSAAGISTGTTPVPGAGGRIEVGGPTQAAATADVAERGPAAIAAASTLSALPIVLGTAGKAAGTSRLAMASGESLRAGVQAIPNAAETSALRYTGLPQIVRPMIKAFKKSMAETAPGAKPAAAPPPVAPPSPDPVALAAAARAAELEDFAPGFSKLSPREQAITEMAYNRIKSGPPPSNAPPAGKIAPLYTPPPEAPPKSPTVAPTVPQAAPPAATAPVPPETPLQANVVPPSAKAEPSAAEVAQTKARGMRAANAETLSQAFQDAGVTSDSLRNLRVWNWPDAAKQVGVDFPVTHSARLKLIRDTLARLQQREAKP